MKKIFTLLAVAAMAFSASADIVTLPLNLPKADDKVVNPVPANTVIASDDNLTATTVFSASAGNDTYTYGSFETPDGEIFTMPTWVQLRVAAEPSADNPYGTDNGGSTSVIIEVKKAMNLTAFVRTGSNKEVKLFNVNSEKLESKRNGDKLDSSNSLWICEWSNLEPATYVLTEKGGTGRLSGFAYELSSSSAITEIAADENAPVEYFNLQGMRVENPANGLFIKRQGSKVSKVIIK